MKPLKPTIGFALTGSFCTLEKAFRAMEQLSQNYHILPIVSERVANTDTRFFKKEEILARIEAITGQKPILTIPQAEPLGPGEMLDLLLVCPCTGNTLSKISLGITDSVVPMAVKSHRRRGKSVLLAISTNDALSGSGENLGRLLDKKGFFFVPMTQDMPQDKPSSLSCDFSLLPSAVEQCLNGIQLQPIFR